MWVRKFEPFYLSLICLSFYGVKAGAAGTCKGIFQGISITDPTGYARYESATPARKWSLGNWFGSKGRDRIPPISTYGKIAVSLQKKYGIKILGVNENEDSYFDWREMTIGVGSSPSQRQLQARLFHESVHGSLFVKALRDPSPKNLALKIYLRSSQAHIPQGPSMLIKSYEFEHYLDELKAFYKTALAHKSLSLQLPEGSEKEIHSEMGKRDLKMALQLIDHDKPILIEALNFAEKSLTKKWPWSGAPKGLNFQVSTNEIMSKDLVNISFYFSRESGSGFFLFAPYFKKGIKDQLQTLDGVAVTQSLITLLQEALAQMDQFRRMILRHSTFSEIQN